MKIDQDLPRDVRELEHVRIPMPDGTHLDYAMLPQKLKAAGYYSVHVGKWHQGLYAPQYTPVGRGFDYSFGFLEGGEDHIQVEMVQRAV